MFSRGVVRLRATYNCAHAEDVVSEFEAGVFSVCPCGLFYAMA